MKKMMQEIEIDLVILSHIGQRFKRIADTVSGVYIIIPLDGDTTLLCHSVDLNSCKEESWIQVEEITNRSNTNKTVINRCDEYLKNWSRIGVEVNEFNHHDFIFLKEHLNGELVDIHSTIIPEVFFGLYPNEIKFQRKVSELADLGCTTVRETMRKGMTEYELAAEAEYAMRREGTETTTFNTIISTGPRSAYSHGWPTDRKLKEGDFLLVDLGPQVDGYAGDETRTYVLGSDSETDSMLRAVDVAVQRVIDEVKPGVSCRELDTLSRKVINEYGYPDYPHSLGHPLSGFATPNLSKVSEDILREGMLFTIEPGIYLPGYGGVPMEENVVVTSDGCEQLTKSPRFQVK
jgi:Xaa-Pro dipeptidase